jgi:hypothetical protein
MALPALVTAFVPFLDKILDMIPNPEARAKAKQDLTLELVRIEAEQRMAQVDLNKQEAVHGSIFVAGWRPFIGWVGGVSLAWTFLVHPLLVWVATVAGYTGTFPMLDTDPLMTLVMAMLGVGAMRSFDKLQGVHTKAVGTSKTIKTNKEYNG